MVIFGGASPEYFATCTYAASILEAIDEKKYHVHRVGVTQSGAWYLTEAPLEAIADGESWVKDPSNKKAILSPDREDQCLLIFDGDTVKKQKIDVVFPFIMGETGEDGAIQGLLQMADIPWVGSNVCASACGMDKGISMIFSDLCGFKRPEYYICQSADFLAQPKAVAENIVAFFRSHVGEEFYPIFVKPATTGSSIGISKVQSYDELMVALEMAAPYSFSIIIEQGIVGRELKVAVLGNENPITGECCEIEVKNGIFNTYEMKYKVHDSHKKIPAELPENVIEDLKNKAIMIYRKMGCSGFARVDFFVTDDMEIVFNEINTEPGFGRSSIFSQMFAAQGLTYEQVVDKLLDTANK